MTTAAAPAVLPAEAQAMQTLYQLGTGHMVAAAVQVVLRLDIPDRLAAGPRTADDLARETGVHADALYRVLRSLSSVGLFEEQEQRRFALTLAGSMMRKGPGSFRDMGLWITSPFHFRVYADMMHSVETGTPAAEKTTGMPVFEYLAGQPELSAIFNNAMTAFSSNVAPAVLKVYDFSGIGTLVDVAGGHGQVLATILQAYPRMQGVLFDLSHVIAGAQSIIEAAGVGARCRTVSGDFFKAVPEGDAYIMKHIIHDWDDERATLILQNIRAAMNETRGGRVILIDSVLAGPNQPDFGKIVDLEMMMMPGGRERSEDEFRCLFAGAGFTLTRIERTESPLCVIEARPLA